VAFQIADGHATPAIGGADEGGEHQFHGGFFVGEPGDHFAAPANPTLVRMRQIAQMMSQAQGWNTTLAAELDRALVVLLSGHADDQWLRYSQLVDVLHRYGVSISRVAEVLSRGGLLDDDCIPAFESWLEDKLAALAPGIAADVRAWIRTLHHEESLEANECVATAASIRLRTQTGVTRNPSPAKRTSLLAPRIALPVIRKPPTGWVEVVHLHVVDRA
jgi:hypothetical protein